MPTVVAIPAVRKPAVGTNASMMARRRVAGYARVSTEHDEQQTSYENQVSYYTKYIKGRADWEFAGMYSDEGITGTNTKKRDGFNQMVKDALAGKIDLIVTKSVSRFARNTVDTLVTVRKLKEAMVEVYFEKENIWTLDSKGELLITIMSSLAQEESRNISENTTWGKRKKFAEGQVTVAYARFLGYDRGKNGGLVINKKQAVIVRQIYSMFLKGMTFHGISRKLEANGVLAPGGGKRWSLTTLRNILTNEKYKGDALLQKSFTVDFLTKKKKKNEGEVPQYYIEGSHEPIVSPTIFEMVQQEMARRKSATCVYSAAKFLSGKIKCGECGAWYGSKIWHSNDKFRREVYQCNHKYDGGTKCMTPAVSEEEIHAWFIKAVNRVVEKRDEIIANLEDAVAVLDHEDEVMVRQKEAGMRLEELRARIDDLVARNASKAMNQKLFKKQYGELAQSYDEAAADLEELSRLLKKNRSRRVVLRGFIKTIRERSSLIDSFDENIWIALFDCMVITSKEDVRFVLKDGSEIRA